MRNADTRLTYSSYSDSVGFVNPPGPRFSDSQRKLRMVRIGRNVQAARAESGLNQTELAAKLNVSQATVSRWERGVQMIDSDTLWRLGRLLNVNVSSLFEPHADEDPEPNGEPEVAA